MALTSERAREIGRRGGKAGRKLNLERVERELGELTTIEDAQRRLDRIGLWAAAGMLPGAVAGACVRSIEVWLKAQDSQMTREVVENVKGQVQAIERKMATRRGEIVGKGYDGPPQH